MNKVHILLVEDNPIAVQAATFILEKMDCMIDVAKNGEDAVVMAQKLTYELVLMDIGLPGINGVQACELIRQGEKVAGQTPVLMFAVTANDDPQQAELCKEAGMHDVVVKPLTFDKAKYILSLLKNVWPRSILS